MHFMTDYFKNQTAQFVDFDEYQKWCMVNGTFGLSHQEFMIMKGLPFDEKVTPVTFVSDGIKKCGGCGGGAIR